MNMRRILTLCAALCLLLLTGCGKNAEPSELALGLGRAAGILMIVIGIICFFI